MAYCRRDGPQYRDHAFGHGLTRPDNDRLNLPIKALERLDGGKERLAEYLIEQRLLQARQRVAGFAQQPHAGFVHALRVGFLRPRRLVECRRAGSGFW